MPDQPLPDARWRAPGARAPRLRRGLLLLAALLMLGSWVRPLARPEGWLLELGGRPVDVLGQLQDHWHRWQRDCRAVRHWPGDSATAREVQAVLAGYSPPASASARPVQLLGLVSAANPDTPGDWLLAEVQWDDRGLDPAIVPLRRAGGVWQVQAEGVWSGDTGPWWGPPVIRRYLARRLPALPVPLRDCLDPRLRPFAG